MRDGIETASHAAHDDEPGARGMRGDRSRDRGTIGGVVTAADDRNGGPLQQVEPPSRKDHRGWVGDGAEHGGKVAVIGHEDARPDGLRCFNEVSPDGERRFLDGGRARATDPLHGA